MILRTEIKKQCTLIYKLEIRRLRALGNTFDPRNERVLGNFPVYKLKYCEHAC